MHHLRLDAAILASTPGDLVRNLRHIAERIESGRSDGFGTHEGIPRNRQFHQADGPPTVEQMIAEVSREPRSGPGAGAPS